MPDSFPSDLPDPASPTPVTPTPVLAPAAVVGSKIRSRPEPVRAASLPGTYAANYGGDDMSWRRGVGVLWTLFVLAGAAELLRAAFFLLAGHAGWPLSYEVVRVGIAATVFVTLWLGWGWSRWLLVVADFLFGAWTIIMVVAGNAARHSTEAVLSGRLPAADSLIETLPKLALGVVCLITAGYLAFSADVVDFLRHRREEGRGWVTLPVAALAAGYVALVCLAQLPYWAWIGYEEQQAKAFGNETLRAMCDHWNPDALAARGDENFLASWPDAARRASMASLSPLGEMKATGEATIKTIGTATNLAGTGFVVGCNYDQERVEFAHGHAHFNFALAKPLLGGWRLNNFVVYDIVMDQAPVAPPAAAPSPASVGTRSP